MKNCSSKFHSIHNFLITILLLGGGLFAAAGLASCENFLDGGDVKREIEDAIAYNNAKQLTVLLSAQEGTGSTLPSGNYTAKQGYDFEISFSENPAYSFVKWTAVSRTDSKTEITDGITFEDKYSSVTKVKITNLSDSIKIVPLCEKRIEVYGEPNPRYEPIGVSRDRSITVNFTKELAVENFFFDETEIPADAEEIKKDEEGKIWAYIYEGQTYLKNVSITNSDDYSIAEHFTCPVVEGKLLTIGVDKTNPIKFNAEEIRKTVKVSLSKNITDTLGIKMNAEKSWNYQITESTDEKATVTLTSVAAEGSVYLAGTKDYSLGQKITLSFTEDADYQFIKWDYDSSIIFVAEPESANTIATVLDKTSGEDSTQIKAVCAPRLRVTEYSPVTDGATQTVCKNSSIVISFNHKLPTSEEDLAQLQNISITIGGAPVKSSFTAPVINEDTITFAADNSNMLDVPAGQKKTVSVTVPADFYYTLEDGTKITYGGNGKSFDYKIDDTTLDKAEITFAAANGSGELTAASGTKKYSIGQEVPLIFVPADGWTFNGWSVMCGGQPVDESKIKIADVNALSTKLTVYEALTGVTVRAKTSRCLEISETSPAAQTNPKDSSIIIKFNKDLAAECASASMLNKIEISSDVKLDSYYTKRTLSGDTITIENTSPLSVPKGTTKVITVTVPSDFYYENEGNKINLTEKSFSFKVDYTTNAKAKVTYQVINGETDSAFSPADVAGTIEGLESAYQEYNIGEDAELSFALNTGYQFYGWKLTDADSANGLISNQVSFKDSSSKDLQPTLVFNKPINNLVVNVICYKRPVVSTATVSPYDSNSATEVPKNTPIVITFDHAISSETKDEIIINYSAIANFNKETYFSTTISDDNKTVTLTPIKMLPLEHAYETVKVTVPCDKVYYLDEERNAKITTADSDFSWLYRINSSTMSKTTVKFATTDAAVTGRQISAGGVLHSSGTTQALNVEQIVKLEYPSYDGYQFAGWKVEAGTTGYTVEPDDYVTNGTITVKAGDKTYFTLVIDESNPAKAIITSYDAIGNGTDGYGIAVLAKDVELPVLTKAEPTADINPKDSKIKLTCNKSFAAECATLEFLKTIEITLDGQDVGTFFETRKLNENTIEIENTKLLDVTGKSTKTVKITVPNTFYYENDDGLKVYLSKPQSFSYKVDSSTNAYADLDFDCGENSGLINLSDEKYYLGTTKDLKFTPSAGYKFVKWIVYYIDEAGNYLKDVDDEDIFVDDYNSTSTKLHINSIADDETIAKVKVYAQSYLEPVVQSVKVNGKVDLFSLNSINCDNKIHFVFNKAMDVSSFSLSRLGSITVTKSGNNGTHYEDYFDVSWVNPKEFILTPKNTIRNLVPNSTDLLSITITLNANSRSLKDSESHELCLSDAIYNSFSINFTIAGTTETTPPVITDINMYSTDDTSDYYFRKLSDTAFSKWTNASFTGEEGLNYKDGVFNQNHVSSVYIVISGYDSDSGIKEIQVTETYLCNSKNQAVVQSDVTHKYESSPIASKLDTTGNLVKTYSISYHFDSEHTMEDGLFSIDVSFLDNAGNQSEKKTYYVIKDTSNTTTPVIKTPGDIDYLIPVYNDENNCYEMDYYFNTFKPGTDYYFENINTNYHYVTQRYITVILKSGNRKYEIYKGDIEDTGDIADVINSAFSGRKRNVDIDEELIIKIKEESGVEGEFSIPLYKRSYIAGKASHSIYLYDQVLPTYKTDKDEVIVYFSYTPEPAKDELIKYYYGSTEQIEPEVGRISYLFCCLKTEIGSSEIYRPLYLNKPYIFYNGVDKPESDPTVRFPTITLPDTSLESGEIQYEPNTGRATFSINLNYPDDGYDYSQYTYILYIGDGELVTYNGRDEGDQCYSDTSKITTWTGRTPDVYLIAYNSDCEEVARSEPQQLDLTVVDNHSPVMYLYGNNHQSYNSINNYHYMYSQILYAFTPYDYNEKKERAYNLTSVDCYFVPSSYGKALSKEYVTSGLFKKASLSLSENYRNDGCFSIPYDGIDFGRYYVYFYLEDNSPLHNWSITPGSYPLVYYVADYVPDIAVDTGNDKINISAPTYTDKLERTSDFPQSGTRNGLDNRQYIHSNYAIIQVLEDNKWTESVACSSREGPGEMTNNNTAYYYSYYYDDDIWVYSADCDTYSGKFVRVNVNFTSTDGQWQYPIGGNEFDIVQSQPKFIYPDYSRYKGTENEIICKNKNWVEGSNGYQIFTDNPMFVHTLHCSRNLNDVLKLEKPNATKQEKINEWESRAQETGIVSYSGNTATSFTYGSDCYKEIPEGNYYVTIAYFADGTILMGDVKQK